MKDSITWEDFYELCYNYYNFYGNLNVNINFKTFNGIDEDINGYELGKIINEKKKLYHRSKLELKEIIDLEKIGIDWDNGKSTWQAVYDDLKEYYETHGNLLIPYGYIGSSGYNLSTWVKNLRKSYQAYYNPGVKSKMLITEKQINDLNNIGMIWAKDYLEFYNYYLQAKSYYDMYGNLAVNDDSKLSIWLKKQRVEYSKFTKHQPTKLTIDEINLLNDIGMIWNKYNFINILQFMEAHNITYWCEEETKKLQKIASFDFKRKYELLFNNGYVVRDLDGHFNPLIYLSYNELYENININDEDKKRIRDK